MKHLILSILLLPCILIAESNPDNVEAGLPSKPDTIINRQGYALGYNEQHEQAEWVSYKLTKDEVLNKALSRTDNFREDPLVLTGSAALSDYRGSGYDRGHLAPAADMHFNSTTMSESFFMSNMSPQMPYFNRGIWKKLEALIRTWAVENDEIYVVTAPVLTGELTLSTGSNQVTVPDYYYKVVLDYKPPEVKAIGFILKNEKSSSNLVSFACSVDKVEEITGLDFFSNVPDDIENKIESEIDVYLWAWSSRSHAYSHHSSAKRSVSTTAASSRSSKFHIEQ